jgi:hypothetical protein
MSPVNEFIEEPEVVPVTDRVASTIRHAVGASDRLPVRVLLLFVVVVICTAMAPLPANLVGVAAAVLLALDTSLHRRRA